MHGFAQTLFPAGRHWAALILLVVLSTQPGTPVLAGEYPDHTVKIIVPMTNTWGGMAVTIGLSLPASRTYVGYRPAGRRPVCRGSPIPPSDVACRPSARHRGKP